MNSTPVGRIEINTVKIGEFETEHMGKLFFSPKGKVQAFQGSTSEKQSRCYWVYTSARCFWVGNVLCLVTNGYFFSPVNACGKYCSGVREAPCPQLSDLEHCQPAHLIY